jgi:ABC-type branched-subunit amino acid transport system substrate-binding protein
VKALKDAGATHVLLTTLPSATPGILGTAAKMKYGPQWIGNTPAWVDVFFKKLPEPLLKNFLWVTGLAHWGEEVPGMKEFLEVWEKHGQGMGTPDFYVLASYVHGLVQMEALKRAIEANDVTRAGFKKALRSIKGWNAGGLTQPVDLTATPYVTSTRTRILQPKVSLAAPQSDQCDFRNPSYAKGTCTRWMMVKDYAEPKTK